MTHTTPILLSADFQGADSLRWERLRSVSAGRTVRLPAPAAPVLSPITRARYTVYDLLLTVDHAVRFGSTPQPRTVRLPAPRRDRIEYVRDWFDEHLHPRAHYWRAHHGGYIGDPDRIALRIWAWRDTIASRLHRANRRPVRLPALRAGVDEANLSRAILWHELRLTPTLPVRLPAPAILR
jgi:hypothetical protein